MRSLTAAIIACVTLPSVRAAEELTVGSKTFTESVILGELATQLAQRAGAQAKHRRQLGGSSVLWNALQTGAIDLYPEYTGTIRQELLSELRIETDRGLRAALAERGLAMSRPLGFNNTYAIGMKASVAERLGIRTISDLRRHPTLTLGFTNEVINRGDGWPGLREHYGLPQRDVRGMEHSLAYPALEAEAIQATDLYSTDPEIAYYGLRVLEDDLQFFPAYHAVLLYRADLTRRAPHALESILRLEGRISDSAMVEMNARAKPKSGERAAEDRVAYDFLEANPQLPLSSGRAPASESFARLLLRLTAQHLYLVIASLAAAIVVGIPLGIAAARWPTLSQLILSGTGIIQTIPALALLVFLIPLFGKDGLGPKPAIVALFLYSLLPIVRNTYAGLHDVPLPLKESALALGLSSFARLWRIELPMASRSILAGIKTSAVINVGTATLGGLIGAGGYGDRIITGLRLDNTRIILEGAIPAALMALVVQWLFDLAERKLVPRGAVRPDGA
jgi:osmoprotectant transport system permease protein